MPNGFRHWCFTLNNPTDEEKLKLPRAPQDLWPHATHLVYQLEVGENNTPHIQGYVRFSRQRTLIQVRQLIHRAHFEHCKGTPLQNYEYCTKEEGRLDGPVVIGEFGIGPRGSGKRADGTDGNGGGHLKRSQFLDLIQEDPHTSTAELIALGGLSVLTQNPNLLGIARGYLLADVRRDGITVELYYGPTDVGKSRLADYLFPDAFRKAAGPWWDLYEAQLQVILEDFDSDFCSIGDLLRVLDRYSLRVPVKGSFVQCVANHFIITSNELPDEWYPNATAKRLNAVKRRINTVIDFTTTPPRKHSGKAFFDTRVNSPGEVYDLPWLVDTPPDAPPSPTLPLPTPRRTPRLIPFEFEESLGDFSPVPQTPILDGRLNQFELPTQEIAESFNWDSPFHSVPSSPVHPQ